jgi:hypothetical protein
VILVFLAVISLIICIAALVTKMAKYLLNEKSVKKSKAE